MYWERLLLSAMSSLYCPAQLSLFCIASAEKGTFMRFIASMFALMLIATPAASQNASASHDQAALEFLEVLGMPKLVQQVSVAMVDNLSERIRP